LGNLIDAESNKGGISIHNKCTSWGGDMVADAYGKLYIISANHQIFKVDIDTRITTHIGTITGLPANYTTNGAAVDDNENIVVSSANTFEGYYRFSLKDLAATKIENSDTKYNASDLANGNLLFQKEADAKRSFGLAPLPQVVASTDARIYPNPVTTGEFKVLFDGLQAGQYTVAISDLSGKALQATKVMVSSKLQAQTVKIGTTLAKGMYLVKVTDATNKMIFTDRIMVQ
jgi:Secretion system C-terminal sorting domain